MRVIKPAEVVEVDTDEFEDIIGLETTLSLAAARKVLEAAITANKGAREITDPLLDALMELKS